jgi:hypothetical protein
MYKLGRQISADINNPATIFVGAAHIWGPPEKVPTTTP